jgi:hypothetical protein
LTGKLVVLLLWTLAVACFVIGWSAHLPMISAAGFPLLVVYMVLAAGRRNRKNRVTVSGETDVDTIDS